MNVLEEFANIPNAKMRRLGSRLQDIQRQMSKLAEEANEIRKQATEELGIGRYDTLTVYKVKETWVKRHFREGHKAVRVRTELVRGK